MPSLRELQLAFSRVLADDPGDADALAAAALVVADGIPAARRLQVYRNNSLATLAGALEAVYPVVCRLVGEECFGRMARDYARRVPSRCGDLHRYGGDFADFLARAPGLGGLPYLPGVARLEWSWHQVFHAPEAPCLALAALAEVPPERHHALRFELHPAAALVGSPYPVLRIWQVNQDGWEGDATVSLDAGRCDVLVLRRGQTVELIPLDPAEARVLAALAAGETLEHALSAAFTQDPNLDAGACLQRHLTLGSFSVCRA